MRILVIILLICISQNLRSQQRSTITNPTTKNTGFKGQTFAILIGVSEYKHLPSLSYAARDASLMKYFLMSEAGGNVPSENLLIFQDSMANTGNITVTCFEWLRTRNMRHGDRIFFYMAGHGDSDYDEQFFLTYDAIKYEGVRDHDISGNLELSRLKRWLKKYVDRGVEVALIIDACRTKDVKLKDSVISTLGKRFTSVQQDVSMPGFNIFYAAQDGSPAFESGAFGGGHGLFTYYFVLGASGEADKSYVNDGKVTVYELGSYLKQKVPQASRTKFQTTQIPKYCCDLNDERELFSVADTKQVTPLKDDLLASFQKLDSRNNNIYVQDFSTRTASSEIEPGVIKVYNKFQEALKSYKLVYGQESALASYYTLLNISSNAKLKEQARLQLISRLVNFAKISTIKYLLGIDEKLIKQKTKQRSLEALEYEELSKIGDGIDFIEPSLCLEVAMQLTDNTDLKDYLRPRLYFLKARSYFNRNPYVRLDQAIKWAEEIVKFDSSAAHAYHLLAMLENENGDLKKATEYISKAVTIRGDYNTTSAEVSLEFIKMKKLHEASLFYRLGTLNAEQLGSAFSNLGILNVEAGNSRQAERWFKLAVDKDPSLRNLRNLAIFYLSEAKKAKIENRIHHAELLYTQALKTNIEKDVVLTSLGTLYQEQDQHASARDVYLEALRTNRNYVPAMYNLAIVYFNNHFYDSAVHYCKRILKIEKKDTPVYKNAWTIILESNEQREYFRPGSPTLFNKREP